MAVGRVRTWRKNRLSLLCVAMVPAETAGCTGLSHPLAGPVSPKSCHCLVTFTVRIWGHLPGVTQGHRWSHPLWGCREPWLQAQAPWGWAGDAKRPSTAPQQTLISCSMSNHGWHQPDGSETPKGQPFCCPSAEARLDARAGFPCSGQRVGRGAKSTAMNLPFVCQANVFKHLVSSFSMLGGQVQAVPWSLC